MIAAALVLAMTSAARSEVTAKAPDGMAIQIVAEAPLDRDAA